MLLWFQALDKRISPALRHRIENADEEYFVSLVSFWEIAIKTSIGKLNLDRDLNSTFQLVHEAGFSILPLREEHILEAARLPLHHRDPFDRMLIAQAKTEDMHLLTAGLHFAAYDVPLIKA